MYTLLQLRRELARTVDSYVGIMATGGSTTTIVDTNLLDSGEFPDDSLIGATAYVVNTTDGLAPKGQGRYVTDYNSGTGVVTLGHAFSAAVDPGDEIDLYTRYSLEELNTALMLAVRDWRLLAVVANVAPGVYTITGNGLHDMGQIKSIWYRPTGQDVYVPLRSYNVFQDGSTITLELTAPLFGELRVEYEARYGQLKTGPAFDDTKIVGGDLEHHLFIAQAHLFRRKMQSAVGPDRDWYASLYRETIERLERSDPVRQRAGRAKSDNWREPIIKRYQPPYL